MLFDFACETKKLITYKGGFYYLNTTYSLVFLLYSSVLLFCGQYVLLHSSLEYLILNNIVKDLKKK